jgi:hypothetical protein
MKIRTDLLIVRRACAPRLCRCCFASDSHGRVESSRSAERCAGCRRWIPPTSTCSTRTSGRGDYVTLIANYLPLQDPYGGPNYFALDQNALYEIHVDSDGDAVEDLTFQFRFKNRLGENNTGAKLKIGDQNVAVPLKNIGPITAQDVSNLNFNESYTLTVVRGDRRTGQASPVTPRERRCDRVR